ncbi:hypothetical protein Zmor_017792 [Zophobas morio]|uniref:THAP-type domain-containing protein n=1 Tax=Zophobas morio TaxID=2755281 RepID=A0AA38ID86_9CUCU|nr:hypothetical protein Zmor_017792 [Zophobas morio]
MAKQCFFVGCDNNSTNNPEKLFLTVPQKVDRRKLWFEAVGRTYIPGKSLYCCEDHFDLEKDAENWIHFKLMGTRLMLKDNVVPRSMVRKETSSQFTPTSRKRKMETQQHSRGLRRKLFPEPTVPGTSQDVTEDVEELQLKTVASPSGIHCYTCFGTQYRLQAEEKLGFYRAIPEFIPDLTMVFSNLC